MRDFKSYGGKNTLGANQGINGVNGDVLSAIAAFAEKYEGASESDLLRAIFSEAENRRNAGTLTDKDIDAFSAAISPMLNDKQRQKLNSIVKKLKKK